MAAVAAGSAAALGELVARHQSKVLALAIRMLGRQAAAEDVAQDVFVKVYRAARTYEPTARFTTWLYRITSNRCLDVIRRRRRRTVSLEDVPPPAVESNVAGDLEAAERAKRVRRAVEALPARQRIVVILHRFADLPHRQIAEATGWSASAVESLLARAYAALRHSLAGMMTEAE